MIKKTKMPVDAVVAVTYRCNARCVMCNIWQIKDYPELLPEAYWRLPKSLRDINVSGGEPFLRQDLVEIIKAMRKACPKANINISSNGFLVDTIKKVLPQIKKICPEIAISISIDGIGQMHEAVRRVPNAWPKVMDTLNFCRNLLGSHKVKMAFTLNDINYTQLQTAFEWSNKLGVEFTMAIAHSSDIYFGKAQENKNFQTPEVKKQFEYIIRHFIKSLRVKDWARAYFVDGLYKLSQGEKRPLQQFAGEDFFFLDPRGDVYPSVIDSTVMGNIFSYRDFKDLWNSKEAASARAKIRGFEDDYWMVCTARTAMKRNPLTVANWIFKKKLSWGK
ncbi:MAG: hypothetical protein UT32_C0005G0039 [Parcubacteria group bacterium GW2011_GWC2_39_14]|nr:MAG: hypothetical protein UT32_C0005G0039 [Parcubacteria group bacterium GW2011_GWC2_39_14]KKR54621.1 MAG: hypothetical protein UT91_C0012G0040 [Parcubacteria group bacterium GW2011_GWA2_40_23]